jgi:outer membrane protein assembly factor BamB
VASWFGLTLPHNATTPCDARPTRAAPCTDLRSIAVDQDGTIFAVTINDSHIYEFDPNGVLLRSVDTGTRGYTDLTMDASGRLVATSGGTLVLTDRSLSSFTPLDVGTISVVGNFAALLEPPVSVTASPRPAR